MPDWAVVALLAFGLHYVSVRAANTEKKQGKGVNLPETSTHPATKRQKYMKQGTANTITVDIKRPSFNGGNFNMAQILK